MHIACMIKGIHFMCCPPLYLFGRSLGVQFSWHAILWKEEKNGHTPFVGIQKCNQYYMIHNFYIADLTFQ